MLDNDLILLTSDSNKFGLVLARTIRIIGKLLYDWCFQQEKVFYEKKGYYPTNRPHLTAIYFDKLSEFYCRTWDNLKTEEKVRDASGLRKRRGFHGPGRAISFNRKEEEDTLGADPDDSRRHHLAYTTEIVEKLKSGFGNDRILFNLKKYDPWDYRCQVHPNLDQTQWENWVIKGANSQNPYFLTSAELLYVDEISRLLCLLDQEEIRAIGTHHACSETIEDIRFNLEGWESHFNQIISFIMGTAVNIQKSVNNVVITADEIIRKSGKNRKFYKSAREKILSKVDSPYLKKVFEEKQEPDTNIWENETIKKFYQMALPLYSFSVYCRRCIFEMRMPPPIELDAHDIKESDDLFGELQEYLTHHGISIIPIGQIKNCSRNEYVKLLERTKAHLFNMCPPIRNLNGFNID